MSEPLRPVSVLPATMILPFPSLTTFAPSLGPATTLVYRCTHSSTCLAAARLGDNNSIVTTRQHHCPIIVFWQEPGVRIFPFGLDCLPLVIGSHQQATLALLL